MFSLDGSGTCDKKRVGVEEGKQAHSRAINFVAHVPAKESVILVRGCSVGCCQSPLKTNIVRCMADPLFLYLKQVKSEAEIMIFQFFVLKTWWQKHG